MHRAYICGSVRASCHEKSFEIIIAAWSSLWGKIALRSCSVHGEVTFYPGLCGGQWFAIQVLVWCSGSTLCGPVLYHPDPCWGEVARLPGRCVENRLSNILHNLIIPEIFKKKVDRIWWKFQRLECVLARNLSVLKFITRFWRIVAARKKYNEVHAVASWLKKMYN